MSTTLTPPPELSELSAADRCDRCGAQARVRAVLPGGGDLVFCGHHAREYDEQLRKVAVEIIDHSDEIDNTTSPAREF